MFGSPRAFHDFLVQFVPDTMERFCFFPPDQPKMNGQQIVEYFEAQGDEQGARLAKLDAFLFGSILQDQFDAFNGSASFLYTSRQKDYI